MPRDYAYEALAEVTSTDQGIGRGELNFSLKKIREQEPDLTDSYLLSAEIHERAGMYRRMFPDMALTPTALAKHWQRVKHDAPKKVGANLTAERPSSLPPRHQQGLQEVHKLMETLWPPSSERDIR